MLDLGITRRRISAAAVAFLLALTPVTPAPAEGSAGTMALSLAGFVVAADGRLYRAPAPGGGSSGGGLVRVSSGAVAPPGAGLSTVHQSDGNLALFLIGTHGGLVAATTSASGSGLTFFNVGSGGLAVPGGKLSATVAPDGVHVFFPARDGSIYAVSFGPRVKPQPVPYLVSLPGLTPASAAVAAGWDSMGVPGVFLVGVDGGLHSVWRDGTVWTTYPVSPPGVAPPGGGVATLSGQGAAQAFFAGNDGTLWQVTRPGPVPYQPQAISAAGSVPPGAHLAAAHFAPRPEPWQRSGVFFAAADGAVNIAAHLESGWLAPAAATPPGTARPGAAVSVVATPDDPYLYVAWCGNDSLWWWLRWRKLVPPPPQPPWYGETYPLRPVVPVWSGSNVTAATWGF